MAKPPTTFQVRQQDFPDAPATGFLTPLNTFLRQAQSGLASGLTISENLVSTFVTFKVPAGVPADTYTLNHKFPVRCTGLAIWSATAATTGFSSSIGALSAQWRDNGDGTVTLKDITGLVAGPDYSLTVLCLGEPL